MRRTLTALVTALTIGIGALELPAGAAVPVVVIDGKGWGHGVGMAQEGAFWMGAAGATTDAILAQFYPGAVTGKARGGVRVPVLDVGGSPTSAILAFPDGGEIRESGGGSATAGFPVKVARGAQIRIVFDAGRYRVEPVSGGPLALGSATLIRSTRRQIPPLPDGSTTTTAPPDPGAPPAPEPEPPPDPPGSPPPEEAPPPDNGTRTSRRPLVAVPPPSGTIDMVGLKRRYRGVMEASAASGTLRFVNAVDVEVYLKGMGEVLDPKWPPAALRAQAVAARTYALRAMAVGGEICDTQRCQVYLGAQAEYAAMNKAVDDTRDRVLTFNRSLISAVYSANGGGFSASREEGFGVADGGVPYLRPAPYPTKDTFPWSVTVALSDVAARLGYRGTLSDVRITRKGPSGRALEVVLEGSAGPMTVQGLAFDASLGLRSTLFTLRLESGEPPPAPPPPDADQGLQAPPDAAAAAVAGEITTPNAGAASASSAGRGLGPSPVDPKRSRHLLLVVASWLAAAVAGATGIRLRGEGSTWPRRRPSPSAPRTEDGSP